MALLVRMLFTPFRAVRDLRIRPSWGTAFLVLSLISAATMALGHRARVAETLRFLPAGVTGTQRMVVAAELEGRLPARMLVHPVRLLLGWGCFALVLFLACRAVTPGAAIRYRQFLALEVHCEAAAVLGAAIPLQYWANICTLWYVVLLTGGVSVLCAARPLKAAFVVLLVWGSSLAFHTAVLRFLQGALHLAS